MRQSKNYCLISTIILWYSIPTDSQTHPEFCATENFDGVFYMGSNLTFKSGQWYWQLDTKVLRMMPYVNNGKAMPITTLYINRVLDCAPNKEPLIKDCDQLKKALNLLFIRIANPDTYIETTVVGRVEITNQINDVITDQQLPWALSNPHAIWPSDWDLEPNSSKASLFYPDYNDAFFITNNKNYSELHTTVISSSDWYKRMNRKRLESGITFVGMFHTNSKDIAAIISLRLNAVYAVGHDKSDPNSESKLYWLTKDLRFQYDSRNLRRIFFCREDEVITTSDPIVHNATHQREQAVKPPPDTSSPTVFIIIIVVILIICLIAISVSLLVYCKIKSYSTSKEFNKTSDSKSSGAKTQETDTSTRVSSVETINSHTGSVISKKSTKDK